MGLCMSKSSRNTGCQSWRSKKILSIGPVWTRFARAGQIGRNLFWPPTLTARTSAALWPTETHSTSLKRSKPPVLTQFLFKHLAVLLMYFISVQIILISLVLFSKCAVFVRPICINQQTSSCISTKNFSHCIFSWLSRKTNSLADQNTVWQKQLFRKKM